MTTARTACAVVALLLASCPATAQERPVWPSPPAATRIRYLRALSPEAVRRANT